MLTTDKASLFSERRKLSTLRLVHRLASFLALAAAAVAAVWVALVDVGGRAASGQVERCLAIAVHRRRVAAVFKEEDNDLNMFEEGRAGGLERGEKTRRDG